MIVFKYFCLHCRAYGWGALQDHSCYRIVVNVCPLEESETLFFSPWGIRNSVFQMTVGGGLTKEAKQNKTKNKKQTNWNKQTNRQNTWRFAKHCQTFLDTWLVLATFVEIMSKASNFWKALRSAKVWLWDIQGSTKEVGLERIWKFSILPVLSLSSKTEVSSYLKLMTPTIKAYFLRDSHCNVQWITWE